MSIKVGDTVPYFQLQAIKSGEKETISLADYSGSFIVLFFYPKDNTPFCTKENCAFRDHASLFELEKPSKSVLLGISPDSIESHRIFSEKHQLPFALLSDEHHRISELFGIEGQERFMGKLYKVVHRKTYLIDPSGIVKKIYDVTDVQNHVFEVARDLRTEEEIWRGAN